MCRYVRLQCVRERESLCRCARAFFSCCCCCCSLYLNCSQLKRPQHKHFYTSSRHLKHEPMNRVRFSCVWPLARSVRYVAYANRSLEKVIATAASSKATAARKYFVFFFQGTLSLSLHLSIYLDRSAALRVCVCVCDVVYSVDGVFIFNV